MFFLGEKNPFARENEGKQETDCVGKNISKCYSRRYTFTTLRL